MKPLIDENLESIIDLLDPANQEELQKKWELDREHRKIAYVLKGDYDEEFSTNKGFHSHHCKHCFSDLECEVEDCYLAKHYTCNICLDKIQNGLL